MAMRSPILPFVLIAVLVVPACTRRQEIGAREEEEIIRVLEQISIAHQIRIGRENELLARVETALPGAILSIHRHEDTALVAEALFAAAVYYGRTGTPVPSELADILALVDTTAGRTCYKLVSICSTNPNCHRPATSMGFVDTTVIDNDHGWVRGRLWCRDGRNRPCGLPLGIAACMNPD